MLSSITSFKPYVAYFVHHILVACKAAPTSFWLFQILQQEVIYSRRIECLQKFRIASFWQLYNC
jgi:hypothetical protein